MTLVWVVAPQFVASLIMRDGSSILIAAKNQHGRA